MLSWTVWQFRSFGSQERLEDLVILLKTKSVGEVAVEQGLLAALTPLRDLCGLGDTLVLVVAVSAPGLQALGRPLGRHGDTVRAGRSGPVAALDDPCLGRRPGFT